MILPLGSSSSRSLRLLRRPTARGMTVPGNVTVPRMGSTASSDGILILSS